MKWATIQPWARNLLVVRSFVLRFIPSRTVFNLMGRIVARWGLR